MSEEKKEVKVEEKVKNPDVSKQVANIAFTVRKMKNWLEEKMGADIDGDGRVGGGPYKKALAFLLITGLVFVGDVKADAKTNIANWGGTEAAPLTYIDKSGNIGAPAITVNNFTVNTNATIGGNVVATGSITGQNLTARNGLTVNTNATVGGTLGVTGVATLTATPILRNSLTVQTNATIGGTLSVTGVTTLVSTPVLQNGLTVQTNATVGGTLGVTGTATFVAESVHNAGLDADYITVDAAAGIDVKSTGSLAIGTNTATSINYGGVGVTAHTFTTDGTGTGEVVLPNESIGNAELASGIDAAKLLVGSSASAVNLASGTNLPITVTKETGAVTASGANDLITPACALTPETVVLTNYAIPVAQYATITNANFSVTNVYDIVTNITWTETAFTPWTNAVAAITPDLASNSLVVVTITGGGAVVTNATASNP